MKSLTSQITQAPVRWISNTPHHRYTLYKRMKHEQKAHIPLWFAAPIRGLGTPQSALMKFAPLAPHARTVPPEALARASILFIDSNEAGSWSPAGLVPRINFRCARSVGHKRRNPGVSRRAIHGAPRLVHLPYYITNLSRYGGRAPRPGPHFWGPACLFFHALCAVPVCALRKRIRNIRPVASVFPLSLQSPLLFFPPSVPLYLSHGHVSLFLHCLRLDALVGRDL